MKNAFVNQLQDQHRGKLLTQRSDAEARICRVRDAPLTVSLSERPLVDNISLVSDENGPLKRFVFVKLLENLINSRYLIRRLCVHSG